jgi:hypothetical protein
MRPTLVVISGASKGKTISLDGSLISIGRSSFNDVRLEEPNISRRHGLIRIEGGQYTISDLDSRYGTFVNGECVGETSLTSGAVIQIGNHFFRFCLGPFHELITRVQVTLGLPTLRKRLCRVVTLRCDCARRQGRQQPRRGLGKAKSLVDVARHKAASILIKKSDQELVDRVSPEMSISEVTRRWQLVSQAFQTWKQLVLTTRRAQNACKVGACQRVYALRAKAWQRYRRRCRYATSASRSGEEL